MGYIVPMFNINIKSILKNLNFTDALLMIMRVVLFCSSDGNDPRVSASKQIHLNDWAEILFFLHRTGDKPLSEYMMI